MNVPLATASTRLRALRALWRGRPFAAATAATATLGDAVPTRIAEASIVGGQLVPVLSGQVVEVVDDLPVAHGQLASQPLGTLQTRAVLICEAKAALFHSQHGDVGRGANRQVYQLLLLDGSCGIPGMGGNHSVEQHAHC